MCHTPMYVKLPLESWYPHHFSSVDYESFYNRVTFVNPDKGILTSQRKWYARMMLIWPPILFATSAAAVTSLQLIQHQASFKGHQQGMMFTCVKTSQSRNQKINGGDRDSKLYFCFLFCTSLSSSGEIPHRDVNQNSTRTYHNLFMTHK